MFVGLKEQILLFFPKKKLRNRELKNLSKNTQARRNRARICRSPVWTLNIQNKTELF